MDSTTINRNRDRSAALFTLAAVLLCGLALAGSVWPVVEHATVAALAGSAGIAAATWMVRRIARARREDREDALIAAAWRAAHQPVTAVQGVS